MRCVSNNGDTALVPVAVRLVNPQSPRLYLDSNLKMPKNLSVQVWVWRKKLLLGGLLIPAVSSVIALLTGKEAVIRE